MMVDNGDRNVVFVYVKEPTSKLSNWWINSRLLQQNKALCNRVKGVFKTLG